MKEQAKFIQTTETLSVNILHLCNSIINVSTGENTSNYYALEEIVTKVHVIVAVKCDFKANMKGVCIIISKLIQILTNLR